MSSTLELCMVVDTDNKMDFGQGDRPLVLPPPLLGALGTPPLRVVVVVGGVLNVLGFC